MKLPGRWLVVLGLTLGVAASATAAGPTRWTRIRSQHFIVEGDAREGEIRIVAVRLEQFREAVAQLFPSKAWTSGSLPTFVVVFTSEKSYDPYRPRYQGKPVRVGGYFLTRDDLTYITLLAGAEDERFSVVFHEYAHLAIHTMFKAVPVWFDEGYADFFATFSPASNLKSFWFGRPIRAYIDKVRGEFLPLSDLLTVDHSSPYYNESSRSSVFYAESWALVHYLHMGRPDGPRQLAVYLNMLGAGTPDDQAFRQAFQAQPAEVQSALKIYINQGIYKLFAVTLGDALERYKDLQAEKLGEADAETRLGDLLRQMDRLDDANTHLERALTLGPDSASAQLSMGMTRMQQGRLEEAWPFMERAAGLAPDDFLAQYTLGVSLLRHRLNETEANTRALEALTKAVALTPDSPEALAALALARVNTRTDLAAARRDVQRAIELAPGRLDYRLLLAEVAMRQGDFKVARDTLGPLMAQPRGRGTDSIRERARALMGRLVAVQKAAADRKALGLDAEASSTTQRSSSAEPAAPQPSAPPPPLQSSTQPAPSSLPDFLPVLRKLQPGEMRGFGVVDDIVCTRDEALLKVRLVDRSMTLAAKALSEIEFITYRADLRGAVPCEKPAGWDAVYVTWRQLSIERQEIEGQVVAVEILPKGYVPESPPER